MRDTEIEVVPLAICSVLLLFDQISLLLCKCLFPATTKVLLSSDNITINGRHYATTPGIAVQFRSCVKYLNEAQEQRIRRSNKSGQLSTLDMHKLGYRKVELIYGGNITLIAVISDEKRAAQFAIILQTAYSLSQKVKANTVTDTDDAPLA